MLITNELVQSIKPVIERKNKVWNKVFPNIQFDEWGRAKIKNSNYDFFNTCVDNYFSKYTYRYMCDIFTECFNQYLKDNKLKIMITKIGAKEGQKHYTDELFGWSFIEQDFYYNNMMKFRNKFDKDVEIRMSRVLASVQEIWLERKGSYIHICKELKETTDEKKKEDLKKRKIEIEERNPYFIYQKLLNEKDIVNDVYLTINPLDFLVASGGTYTGGNPTSFWTCSSTFIRDYRDQDYFDVDKKGEYSEPNIMLLSAQINHRGMFVIRNNKTLDVPHTDFSFIGYKGRVNCWLDEDGVYLEKFYPYENKENVIKILEENHIPVKNSKLTLKDPFDFTNRIKLQDKENIEIFLEKSMEYLPKVEWKGTYFDNVAIDRETLELVLLPITRKEYDEANHGYLIPSMKCTDCDGYIDKEEPYVMIGTDAYHISCHEHHRCKRCNTLDMVNRKYTRIEGDWYCDHCIEEMLKEKVLVKCEHKYCRNNIHKMDSTIVLRNGKYLCPDCAKDTKECEVCGKIIHKDLLHMHENKLTCSMCHPEEYEVF